MGSNVEVRVALQRLRTFAACLLLASTLGSCGGGGAPDFGQSVLPDLSAPCQGIAGLTGQAILDKRTDQVQATLSYVTAQGMRVMPTALTIDITWPTSPVSLREAGVVSCTRQVQS